MTAKEAIDIIENQFNTKLFNYQKFILKALWCKEEFKKGSIMTPTKKKRKYYRKCGVCSERHEQSEMIRTNNSPNGWLCVECHLHFHPEYDCEEW